MIALLLRIATGRAVLVALLIFAAGSAALFNFGPYRSVVQAAGGAGLPEEQVTSGEELYRFLEELGQDGRALYTGFQVWDFLNPLLIGPLTLLLVGWLVNRSRLADTRWRWATVIPFVGPVADLVENSVLWTAAAAFPAVSPAAGLLPLVTGAKFAGLLASVACALVLALVAIRRRRRNEGA